jgi:hypothetical protein
MKTNAELMRELINQLNEDSTGMFSDEDYFSKVGLSQDHAPNIHYTGRVDKLPRYKHTVDYGNLDLDNCSLITLYGSPERVERNFICSNNPHLDSLRFGPKWVGGNFDCEKTGITSLKYAPEYVGGNFDYPEHIGGFKGAPKYVGGIFSHTGTAVQSYEGLPATIGKLYINPINNSLKTLHQYTSVEELRVGYYGNITGLMGIFLMKGLKDFKLFKRDGTDKEQADAYGVGDLINNYMHQGRKGMMLCQAELVQGGYEDWL